MRICPSFQNTMHLLSLHEGKVVHFGISCYSRYVEFMILQEVIYL